MKDLVSEILQEPPKKRSGSLCFFGCWLGRPYDNIHEIVDANLDNEKLSIFFDEGEVLEIWNPQDLRRTDSTRIEHDMARPNHALIVQYASRVKWSWYSYGSAKTQEYLRCWNFVVKGQKLQIDLGDDGLEHQSPDIQKPAFALHC